MHTPAIEDRDPRETYANRLAAQDDRYWGTHGHLTWDTPELPLLGATPGRSARRLSAHGDRFDWDFDATDSVVVLFPLDTSSRLPRVRRPTLRWLGTTLDERLDWQTSLFFTRERSDSLTVTTGFELSETGDSGSETNDPE